MMLHQNAEREKRSLTQWGQSPTKQSALLKEGSYY
jgi:hypothetical protein